MSRFCRQGHKVHRMISAGSTTRRKVSKIIRREDTPSPHFGTISGILYRKYNHVRIGVPAIRTAKKSTRTSTRLLVTVRNRESTTNAAIVPPRFASIMTTPYFTVSRAVTFLFGFILFSSFVSHIRKRTKPYPERTSLRRQTIQPNRHLTIALSQTTKTSSQYNPNTPQPTKVAAHPSDSVKAKTPPGPAQTVSSPFS